MNADIKAAFFDIDGTLVSFSSHSVPQSTVLAIDKLKQAGVKCFISSGRHISNIDNIAPLSFDGFVTINGGMTIFDGKVIDKNPINKDDVARMLQRLYPETSLLSEQPLAVSFVLEDHLVMNINNDKTNTIFSQLKFKTWPQIDDLRKYADQDIFQMISFFGSDDEPRIMDSLPHCQSARWSPIFTDVVPKGQSKVRGIEQICRQMAIKPENIMAFGDGGNDVEMLRFAHIGVAMGNASQSVKDNADWVCPSVDDDGILWAVNKLLEE